MKIGIVLTPDARSKAYIQKIVSNNLFINEIIFMNDKRVEPQYTDDVIKQSLAYGFDISKPVKETLLENNFHFKEFNFVDINNSKLIKYVKQLLTDFLIFTGGGILKEEILNVSKFIHLHPGILPYYRGSTCFYYSIIQDDNVGVTAFFMDKNLDTGDIIYQQTFPKPNHVHIDDVFDPFVRSETLIYILKNNLIKKNIFLKQNPNEGETYYIIHPVLKHISILKCIS